MPAFETPEPIAVTIQLQVGTSRIIAGARTDTAVDVRPADPGSDADVKAAEQVRVEYSNGKLLVRGTKRRTLFGDPGTVEVTIELPVESDVHGTVSMGDFRCEGRLGECTLKTGYGDIHVDRAAAQRLDTGYGDVTVGHAAGDAELTTGSGGLEVRTVEGTAMIKNSNGHSRIGEVTGDLRVSSANGDITVLRAHADVNARTACGSVRVGEVVRGSVVLGSAYGDLEIGIREGTAAWLDVSADYGSVTNSLDASQGPGGTDDTVEVRARTGYGDVLVRRA
jgi:DUF4097 and DUF4098 domain-containing protein YvlB